MILLQGLKKEFLFGLSFLKVLSVSVHASIYLPIICDAQSYIFFCIDFLIIIFAREQQAYAGHALYTRRGWTNFRFFQQIQIGNKWTFYGNCCYISLKRHSRG